MDHLTDVSRDIASNQGWDEESIIIHLMGFIAEKELEQELEGYLAEVANEENGIEFVQDIEEE